jgi:hypothetical protein
MDFFTYINRMLYRKDKRSRKNRSASRKNNVSRKNRKNRGSRKNRKNRCWSGGMSPVNDTSMTMPQKDSLSQGSQYLNIHKGQYGGAPAAYPNAVTGSVLTGPMIASARTGPLDTAISQIQGMQDGGRRRRNNRSKKNKRNQRGGLYKLMGSSLSEDSMLLPAGMDKQAALNYEWSAAKDPNFFAPKQ